MTCMYCKGRMKHGVAPYRADRRGYHVTWEAVPAWVCAQCGEAFFEEAQVDQIQEALATLDRKSAVLLKNGKSKGAAA